MSEQVPSNYNQLNDASSITKPSVEELAQTFHYGLNENGAEPIYKALYKYAEVADPQKAAHIHEVLINGTYDGKEIGLREAHRNAFVEADDRIWHVALINHKPELAETIIEQEVAGFHITGSYALAGVLEDGALMSSKALEAEGKTSVTGQHDIAAAQSSISFGSVKEIVRNADAWGGPNDVRTNEQVIADFEKEIEEAEAGKAMSVEGTRGFYLYDFVSRHARQAIAEFQQNPNSLQSTLLRYRFPVAFGVSRSFVRESEKERGNGHLNIGTSDFGEFRPAADYIPMEALPVIAVPADKVQPVSQLLKEFGYDSAVISLDDFRQVDKLVA